MDVKASYSLPIIVVPFRPQWIVSTSSQTSVPSEGLLLLTFV